MHASCERARSALHTWGSGSLLTFSLIATGLPATVAAQTDYYNTDRGRPVTIEDAYATERYAFELQLAPVRLERSRGGAYNWGIEPELTYGLLPRTHMELGFPFRFADVAGSGRLAGLAGINISALHNLNVETRTLPALGLAGQLLMPAGPFGPDNMHVSAKAIATRTFGWARFHVNSEYTFVVETEGRATTDYNPGSTADEAGRGGAELSRWLAGVAVDRTFPLRSMLVTGEVFARQPIHAGSDVQWNAGAGVRYQVDPFFALDAGLGRSLTGDDRSWFVTFGLARAFAIRALMPR